MKGSITKGCIPFNLWPLGHVVVSSSIEYNNHSFTFLLHYVISHFAFPGAWAKATDRGRWASLPLGKNGPNALSILCTGGWFPHLSSSLHRTSSSSLPEERRPLLRPRWAEFHRMPPPFMVVVSAVVAANATPMVRSAGCPATRALAIDERSLLHP